MSLRVIFTYAAIAFTLWWIIQQPANASHIISDAGAMLRTAADGLSHFVASI